MSAKEPQSTRARRTWPQRLLIGVGIVLTMGCLAGAMGAAWANYKFDQIEKYEDLALADVEKGDPANFLIVGSDSRENVSEDDPVAGAFLDEGTPGGRRSDTVMVLRVEPESGRALMLSLPRDLWVPIAGTDEHNRINSAYGDGRDVLAATVQQYLGIPIHHYIEVDFAGFQQMVDAAGGVPMYFERAMRDFNSGLDVLHPGCITLHGPSALAFVRSRHLEYMLDGVWRTDPTGDLGRITRQQLFVRKAIAKAVASGLGNPLTMKKLIDIGVANVGIDDRLSPSKMASLGKQFQSFDSDDLQTLTLPVSNTRTDGGAAVLALDEQGAVPVLDLFRDEEHKGLVPGQVAATTTSTTPGDVAEPGVTVRVLNGARIDKLAANVGGALQGAGFRVSTVGDVQLIGGDTTDVTEIRFQPGDRPAAELLVRHLAAGAELVEDSSMRAGEVTLVAGRDFTVVTAERQPANTTAPAEPTTTLAPTTTAPPVPTTTEPIGRTPGEPPPGVDC